MTEDFHKLPLYALPDADRREILVRELKEKTLWHQRHCESYRNITYALGFDGDRIREAERTVDFPFLPVRIFKEMDLKSIDDDAVFKVMKSSGTTGQRQSRIYLDKENARLQQKVLLRILGDFAGKKRLPMLVIDAPSVLKDRTMFSARGATILGLEFAAEKMVFALYDDMSLDVETLRQFLASYGKSRFLIFGFTFMVWQCLFQEIERQGLDVDMSGGFLVTGGGWKKLVSESVTPEAFKERGKAVAGIGHYMDHYSMAEQSGCIYAACEYGNYHTSIYSDFIPRRTSDFSPCGLLEPGIIQVISVLPCSYPGHSLLTEDEGMIAGVDDCPCGRKGKYIKISGRIRNAELRGCSDTYAAGV